MSVVLSSLLYGSEIWVPLTPHLKALQAFVSFYVCVCSMSVTRWDKKRNTELCYRKDLERVEVMVVRKRLQ